MSANLAIVSDETIITLDPTSSTYGSMADAFSHFNLELFRGLLVPPMFTLRTRAGSSGYYKPDRFRRVIDAGQTADEIALDPKQILDRPLPEVMATFVHQMVHHAQHHFADDFGEASRPGYHNKQFARGMSAIGLPVHSADDLGKDTGQRVEQSITPGGPFDRACTALIASGFTLHWAELPEPARQASSGRNNKRKITYSCQICSLDVSGEPGIRVKCADCNVMMITDD